MTTTIRQLVQTILYSVIPRCGVSALRFKAIYSAAVNLSGLLSPSQLNRGA